MGCTGASVDMVDHWPVTLSWASAGGGAVSPASTATARRASTTPRATHDCPIATPIVTRRARAENADLDGARWRRAGAAGAVFAAPIAHLFRADACAAHGDRRAARLAGPSTTQRARADAAGPCNPRQPQRQVRAHLLMAAGRRPRDCISFIPLADPVAPPKVSERGGFCSHLCDH